MSHFPGRINNQIANKIKAIAKEIILQTEIIRMFFKAEYVNRAWSVVEDFPIIGSNDLKNILEVMHQHGHYIAINSFNSYGSIIPEFLRKIDLSEETIAKINIIAKLPKDPASANKNEYVQESIEKVKKEGFSGNATDVFLIDDSKKNITAARENGYQVIHAKSDASHLSQLKETLLIEINNEQEIINKDIGKLLRSNEEIKNKLDQFDNSKKPLSEKDNMTRAELNSNYLAIKTTILVKTECLSANQKLAESLKTSEENSATKASMDDSLKQTVNQLRLHKSGSDVVVNPVASTSRLAESSFFSSPSLYPSSNQYGKEEEKEKEKNSSENVAYRR